MTADDVFARTLEYITFGVEWVLIPLIMAGLVVVARSMVTRAEEPDRRTSARAGWWAGLLLFVIYFIQALPSFRVPGPAAEGGIALDIVAIVVGAGLGFGILWALSFLSAARVLGFVVLLLTFAGLASLHTYLFLEGRGEWFIAGVLGTALGALLHMIVFPRSLTATEEEGEEAGRPA
jgi:hypothetical protein